MKKVLKIVAVIVCLAVAVFAVGCSVKDYDDAPNNNPVIDLPDERDPVVSESPVESEDPLPTPEEPEYPTESPEEPVIPAPAPEEPPLEPEFPVEDPELPPETPVQPIEPLPPEGDPVEQHTHNLSYILEKKSTCIECGNIEYWYCAECGKSYSDDQALNEVEDITIDISSHKYECTTIQPSCEIDGYSFYRCTVCGDEYTDDVVSAYGHSYGAPETVKAATCTEDGRSVTVCSECGDIVTTIIPAEGHAYSETVISPSCEHHGYTLHACDRCGDAYSDNEVPATGHSYAEEWSSDDEYHWHELICGCDVDTEKLAHVYVDGVCECGHEEPYIYKLLFVLDENNEYTVSGILIAEGTEAWSVDVVIQSEYSGVAVTKIAADAFRDNKEMKSVYIPSSVKYIGANAFKNCSISSAEFESITNWKYNNSTNLVLSSTNLSSNAKALTVTSVSGYWIQK